MIRFNSKYEFNAAVGLNRSSFNSSIKNNLIKFKQKIDTLDIQFISYDFNKLDFTLLTENDFVYCDPPYLITSAPYNDGKRGFNGWNEIIELQLLDVLDNLNSKNIKFALSNVVEHNNRSNDILKEWINSNNYNVNYIAVDYTNCSNTSKNTSISKEVLITNYKSEQINLF
jgi:DNA adenine methylase